MSKREIVKLLCAVRKQVDRDIAAFAARSPVAGGLAREGYNGGYSDALSDVILFLNSVLPRRHNWWEMAE